MAGADVTTSTPLWWKWSVRRLEPLLVSAALAVGLHTVLFSVPVRGQHVSKAPARPQATRVAANPHVLHVRSINAWNASATQVDRSPLADTGLALGSLGKPVDALLGPEPNDRDRQQPIDTDNEKASPPATGLALRIPGALADADFFSRDALDVSPWPAAPVLIEFPSVPGISGTRTGILSLFIDETGKVVRVRVETQAFPPEMQEAARSAFMDAIFTPGLVDGLPVRSKIRVEVTFEAGTASR